MSTSLDHTPLPLAVRRLAVVVGAVAAPAALWWVAGPLAGIEMTANTGGGPTPVGLIAVVTAALVAGLTGWGLLAVLERTTRRPCTAWIWTAAAALAASLAGPLTTSTSGPAGTLTLIALHLATGAVLISLLPRTSAC